MKDKSSETIPNGSRGETPEMVATFVYFYVLKNPIDGSIKYVGRTVDLDNRFRNHIYEAKKNNRNKRERWILSLLRKNLLPKMEVIYTLYCDIETAKKTEKMLIKKIGRKYDLKNQDDFGLGGKVSTKKVYQYTTNGDFVAEYINSFNAQLVTGIKDCNISRCCKNENGYGTKTAGGFFWSFVKYGKYPHNFIKNWRNLSGKPVICINQDGSEIVFTSAREAEKHTGVNHKKISKACNGENKNSGGYTWKFKC